MRVDRSFVHLKSAWYGEEWLQDEPNLADEINIMIDGEDDNNELSIKWYKLTNHNLSAPCLSVFGDAWKFLPVCHDIFQALYELNEDDPSPEPEEVCRKLKELGLDDITVTDGSFDYQNHPLCAIARQTGTLTSDWVHVFTKTNADLGVERVVYVNQFYSLEAYTRMTEYAYQFVILSNNKDRSDVVHNSAWYDF
jgi:hypothetical protein